MPMLSQGEISAGLKYRVMWSVSWRGKGLATYLRASKDTLPVP